MHLSSYLSERGDRQRFARELGVSASTITDICTHRTWPKRELWLDIVRLTKGRVTPNDHLDGPSKEQPDDKTPGDRQQ